ncbi:Xaa-Pro peptidase family protein [uncultured Treponema sp.]|uniref:M24 family metallopeptidase n=1 Tax=uncultured Treponema sp. TaxID=162155 RepID=UPI0025E1F6ED|nr:Xaa-Pro peptidase family protein [uncultured Treponema sp.]
MNFNLKQIYENRRKKVSEYLKQNNIKAAIFEDSEQRRDVAVRYLCGHPSDASLIILDNGKSFLIPWDENLAKDKAFADEIIPSEKFKRSYINAAKEILTSAISEKKSKVCISPETPYIQFKKYSEKLENFKICAEENSAHDFVKSLRAVKDNYEIECTKKAAAITDEMTKIIVGNLRQGKIKTETDVALFAEHELRIKGAERTSFDTLAAGPDRSFAIHAFPGYTQGTWGTQGLSILDYGVCYEGYASDCTITIAKGPLSKEQEQLLNSVQEAADECKKLYMPNEKISRAVKKADEIFAKINRTMPHGLGHGTGLEIHEEPFVSMRANKNDVFKVGNIITLEPGLYDKNLGGTRLENDILITETGNEVLTHSEIFRI